MGGALSRDSNEPHSSFNPIVDRYVYVPVSPTRVEQGKLVDLIKENNKGNYLAFVKAYELKVNPVVEGL